ncbi:DUF6398 domain-containing protein [Pseudonocardia endophytica]|uniref:DUF6398 domain-containing protein n=1 Tax=Pseudonocardia endophytica TaxID=401976 RepID=A0A4R1HKI4_PSEEN|nr:DUF6398 domain-containing protein [Pseudonocardia endophytica]TCK21571.1 hypothetical protein EV378_5559 [Pseudonocardia endophytica]
MSKRPPRSPRRGSTRSHGSRRPSHGSGRAPGPEQPTLLTEVAVALDDGEPLSLLAMVSSLLSALDRPRHPLDEPGSPELPTRADLVESFLDVQEVETSALLVAVAELTGDDLLRRRVRTEIEGRGHPLPVWLTELHRASTGRVVEMRHVLGDGDNLMIEVALVPDAHLTVVVYIDHNMGTLVKDAFVLPEPLDAVVGHMRELAEHEPDTTWADVDPALARSRIEEAVELGAMTYPPLETESWPACRPLVDWAVRGLPAGGPGRERPEWDETALASLADRFFASPFGAGHDDAGTQDLLEMLLSFGTESGPGDPLRWSPVVVEVLLLDWIPRTIVADPGFLAGAPDLVRRFVRFCHRERGIRSELTEETVAAVDQFEPEFRAVVGLPFDDGPVSVAEIVRTRAVRAVGEGALDGLGTEPLPDEPLDRSSIPTDVQGAVDEVAGLVDRFCDERLDVEYRTACRRFLGRVAVGDPRIFRRRARAGTTAAALVWVIGKANDLFHSPDLQVKDMTAHFGAPQSVSQRAGAMLAAVGVDPHDQFGEMNLGAPDLLVSRRRREIVELRDRYRGTE